MDRVVDAIGGFVIEVLRWCARHWVWTVVIVLIMAGRMNPEGTVGFIRNQLNAIFGEFIIPLVDMLLRDFLWPVVTNLGLPALAFALIIWGFRRAKKK